MKSNQNYDGPPALLGDPDEKYLSLVMLIALWAGVIAMWLFLAMRFSLVLGTLALPGLGTE